MPTANQIRAEFLDYFRRHEHEVVDSGPLVPRNDPTLLFTNAGMVPFKNVFTGAEARNYKRAVSSQKCVRAGGKHNDLENVGYTGRHHTFFEMLGNFSFGDYFKEQAIAFAWDLVTRQFGLPPEKLLATVYETDEEAVAAWKKVAGFGDDKILRIAGSDNFWQMGDTGPCGPCSELFYDHGPEVWGGPPGTPEEDGDRYKEIWNLVFMQYEQFPDGTRRDLPKPSIDTGMGLERIAAVLQGKVDNYDCDLLRHLMDATAGLTGGDPDDPTWRPSFKVIADHLRAVSFLIADGVLPSNEGRGYVLRRIMRRGMRHVHMLGARDPLMHRLVGELTHLMGDHFPELRQSEPLIAETLKAEEGKFKQTLDRGLRLLREEVAKLGSGDKLPGDVAFKLYDTYGFPLDLTQDVLRGEGITVDVDGFNAAMAAQRAAARAAWAGSGEAATAPAWFAVRDAVGATEFLGYDTLVADGEVRALVAGDAQVAALGDGETGWVVLNQSPFYAESGGQVGDSGVLAADGGVHATVSDTQQRPGGVIAHKVTVTGGQLAPGAVVTARVDSDRRSGTKANHSATHLLHAALRRHLGTHVMQKGSLVAPDRLRFDISQPTPIGAERLRAIEQEVNAAIRANTPVMTRVMETGEAMRAGAMALFGERYGDEVRVVSMGGEIADGAGGRVPYSMELCGGTHVARTGEIGVFKITEESAVGAGLRRIEAVTGGAALELFEARDETAHQAAELLRTTPDGVVAKLEQVLSERKRLERDLAETRKKLAAAGESGGGKPETREVAGMPFCGRVLTGVSAKELKPAADELKRKLGSAVIALVAVPEGGGKAAIVVGVTDDLTDRADAVTLVKAGAEALGGKGGGGRADMAQAGGPDGSQAEPALDAVARALAEHHRAA